MKTSRSETPSATKQLRSARTGALALAFAALVSGCDSASGPGAGSPASGAPGGTPPAKVDGPCSESLALGEWQSLALFDTLTFGADCSYSSSGCDAQGTVPSLSTASGTAEFSVATTDEVEGCLPAGSHQCAYEIYESGGETRADISCNGQDALTYRKN
jgi:hypothetical protein